ncbi:type II secretion system F family protein [Streptomyces caniscabiei]|uniref:type II secretion system F family protein n=1 Tax=Streptomyces caniscabiei TaxID=2746961 RepID=UPI0029A5E736|nr:type II secretion system F family protein [Streptomyces caniscabiei]MDX2776566.1 type II secretion system F family protein [Streptomyces caniscabiei]
MPLFEYLATNSQNQPISGSIDANDRQAVMSALAKQGLRPVSVKEKTSRGFGKSFGSKKVKSDHIVMFTRQLSAMVGAGVPLLRSLTSLEKHTESAALKTILADVVKDVEGGASLADALAKHPDTFSDVYVNMVRAGEAAGILDEILRRLALQQEKNATIRKKVKSAMAYPMVLVVITVIAFFGLMIFVIPQIGKILTDLGGPDAELPAITQMMLGISTFLTSFWYIIIPVIGGGIYLLMRYIKTPKGKSQFHHLVLKIPGIKSIVTKVVIARFARTFSALMGAGVAVLESLEVTAHAVGNVVYEEALLNAGEAVKNGDQLSNVIDKNPLFPSIVAQMLAVGEETGQTDKVLVKVADFYEEEVDVAIDGLSSIIEPVMIVLMGSMVGLIAASVMVPIASLSQNIKG